MRNAAEANPLFQLAHGAPLGGMVPVPTELAATPAGCLLDALGIRLTHIGVGHARAQMVVAALHLNQRGHPQGGGLVAFADAAAGWATDTALPAGNFATIDLTCYLVGRAGPGATLIAKASTVHLGRTSLVHDVEVFEGDQETAHPRRLIARFTCTQLVTTR